MTRGLVRWAVAAAAACIAPLAHANDDIIIGVVNSQGGASAFVAEAEGYFKAEGLNAKLIQFTSAAPIAAAAASGDIDFGSTGLTAALCNLANGGSLRIIGSGSWERPGFSTIGFLVSNQAYAAGLHGFRFLVRTNVVPTTAKKENLAARAGWVSSGEVLLLEIGRAHV